MDVIKRLVDDITAIEPDRNQFDGIVREEVEIQTNGTADRRIIELTVQNTKTFSKIFKGNLSVDEVKMLPFELKVCWFFQDWNKSFAPRSIEEWAKGIGFLAFKHYEYGEDDYDMNKSVSEAIKTVKSTISYIRDYMMNPVIDNKESEYITELKKHFDDGKPANVQTRRDWF